MPIDPSIPLRAVQPRKRDRDPMRDYGNMLQISELQDQRSKRNAFEQAAQGAVGPDGQIDYDALKGAMAQSGNVMGAVDLDTKLGQRKKAGLDAETAQYNLAKQRLGMMAQVFGQAKDPQSWQRGRAFLSQQGIDVSEVPEQFDPQFAQDAVQQSLSAKDQLDQMWKGKEFGLNERRTAASETTARAAAAGKMGSSMTVQMPGETVAQAEAKDFGKHLVADYGRVSEGAVAAEDAISSLQILRNMDVQSGALEPLKAWAGGMGEALGFDAEQLKAFGLDTATTAQAFEGIAQRMVLTAMQAQKGPQTENDAKRIERTIASLKNTPQARGFLLDAALALEERKIEQRDFYEQWQEQNKTFRGAAKAWNEHKRETPLIGKNPNTGLPVFFNQFRQAVLEANPGAQMDEVMTMWREKYGSAN